MSALRLRPGSSRCGRPRGRRLVGSAASGTTSDARRRPRSFPSRTNFPVIFRAGG